MTVLFVISSIKVFIEFENTFNLSYIKLNVTRFYNGIIVDNEIDKQSQVLDIYISYIINNNNNNT